MAEQKRTSAWTVVGVIALIVVVVAAVIISLDGDQPETAQADNTSVDTSSDDHQDDDAAKCDGYVVHLDKNESNRLLSKGAHGPAPKVRKIVAHAASYDPRVLLTYWNGTFPGKAVASEDELVEGGELKNGRCYTDRARHMHQKLKGQLFMAAVSNGQAPRYGVNTGATAGGSAFQTSPGTISGNRKATKVVYANGRTIWIMHRCGNLVTKKPIPKVPPKPPQPPTPPEEKKCTDDVGAHDGYCGTPTEGPEQCHYDGTCGEEPEGTDGYDPGNAEEVVEEQPDSDDIDTDCGQYGCDSGSEDGAPPGESENTDNGETEQGTSEGTSDPEETEGSQEEGESNTGDPGPPP
jgi:hypothetical protein